MNATKEDIKKIKAGGFKPFLCEDANKMNSVASILSQMKRTDMPDGVVDYEHKKDFDSNIIIVHALREGESKILN